MNASVFFFFFQLSLLVFRYENPPKDGRIPPSRGKSERNGPGWNLSRSEWKQDTHTHRCVCVFVCIFPFVCISKRFRPTSKKRVKKKKGKAVQCFSINSERAAALAQGKLYNADVSFGLPGI